MSAEIMHGNCLDVMRGMADNSVDSIVTDPPYGISFMSKKWDHDVPSEAIWREALRVLKPGGHLLAFFGSRTYHRGVVRIEDAGFEIRDQIMWVYGSGFPKNLDVSKKIDEMAGAEREVIGTYPVSRDLTRNGRTGDEAISPVPVTATTLNITAPATDAAKQWEGFGTALKPAVEPLVLARKPLVGTVAQNVLAHGTGALNIDGARIGDGSDRVSGGESGLSAIWAAGQAAERLRTVRPSGARWPANFIHDGSDEVLALFPETAASKARSTMTPTTHDAPAKFGYSPERHQFSIGDSGSAARFFYCAKASRKDRGEGNTHATVKPTDLMRYLVRLITPPGGTVLDPFCGSGSTLKAAVLEGFNCIGIELDAEYVQIARDRIANTQPALLETA